MLDFIILRLINLVMECSSMAPLTPTVIVTRGFVDHPLFCMLLISGSNLSCLCVMACFRDLS